MKVLIADDHWIVRDSLKHAVRNVDMALEPLEAATFDEALQLLRKHPDIELMLVDLVMPGFSEFEGLRTLRTRYPDIPIAVISVHEDREHVMRAIAEGVIGYIPKSFAGSEILHALSLVINGDVSFPRRILLGAVAEADASPQRDLAGAQLTAREEQILALIGGGLANADIATELGMSPSTVRVHVRNLSMKLKVRERSELMERFVARSPSGGR